MTKDLLVIVPTRGRPQNVARLEKARRDTGADASEFVYVVDHDDAELTEYLRLRTERMIVLRERLRLGPTLNLVAACEQANHPYLGFMGDDHLPKTPGWDQQVLDALGKGGPRVVYGDDLLQRRNLPTAVFLPSRVVRAMGFMCPPDQVHLYLDDFWKALGTALGTLVYLPDVVIEHVHPGADKAVWDAGYAEANAPVLDRADRGAWEAFIHDGRFDAAVARVRREYGMRLPRSAGPADPEAVR